MTEYYYWTIRDRILGTSSSSPDKYKLIQIIHDSTKLFDYDLDSFTGIIFTGGHIERVRDDSIQFIVKPKITFYLSGYKVSRLQFEALTRIGHRDQLPRIYKKYFMANGLISRNIEHI